MYIILSSDVPLLKSDFFLTVGILVWPFGVGICRAVEESNPPRYSCRPGTAIFLSFIFLYKIELNLKFERVFVLVLENTLGPSTVAHYNKNTPTNYQFVTTVSGWRSQSKVHRVEC